MTASDTLPITLPRPRLQHEHAWVTESAHRTSIGQILYVRCLGCDARRVDLRDADNLPPTAQSRTIGAD